MSASRRQDRERKKREKARRQRESDTKRLWSAPRLSTGEDPTGWPVERTWTPMLDAWRATGAGTAAILRRRPDGRFAGAFFGVSLMDDGLHVAADLPDAKPGEFEALLDSIEDGIPPFQDGPADVAAGFAWGSYALSVESGRDWSQVPKLKFALALMPKPPGAPREWADALWEDSIPAGLRRILETSPVPDDLPEGKEIMVVTTATFDADDPARIATKLRKAGGGFHHDGRKGTVDHFALTRPYPKNHDSPLAALGGRQVVGRIEVHRDASAPRLVAEGNTLSMTCALIQQLKRVLGDAIQLADTRWKGADELLREHRGRDAGR